MTDLDGVFQVYVSVEHHWLTQTPLSPYSPLTKEDVLLSVLPPSQVYSILNWRLSLTRHILEVYRLLYLIFLELLLTKVLH